MGKKFFCLILSLCFAVLLSPVWANPREQQLEYLIKLVNQEYVEKHSLSNLTGSAFTGMKKLLKSRNLNSDFLEKYRFELNSKNSQALLEDSFNQALKEYPELTESELYLAAVKEVLSELKDRYTEFLSKDEYSAMMESMQAVPYAGIGVIIRSGGKNGYLEVVEPVEDSPALKAGLKAGDLLLKINEVSTWGMTSEDAQKYIRGPEGTKVKLSVKRQGRKAEFTLQVVRKKLKLKALSYHKMGDFVGYLKLTVFGDEAADEVKIALNKLRAQGAKAFILDLRNNGGGYIDSAIDILSLFLPSGSTATKVYSRKKPMEIYYTRPEFYQYAPLVIFANAYSASASEITAAALRENRGVKILGEKTYGKASVQKIYPLPDGSAVKLTVAHYLTPKGYNLDKRGLQPDLQVSKEADFYLLSDKVLRENLKPSWNKVGSLGEALRKAQKQLTPDYRLYSVSAYKSQEKLMDKLVYCNSQGKKVIFIFENMF